jgi:hypothetical protein
VSVAGESAGGTPQGTPAGRRGVAGVTDWLEAQSLFILLIVAASALCLIGAAAHFAQDAYVALVDGRVVAHGIPHHSYLTVMAYGVRWVDQQWLAQLAFYGLQRLGGYALLAVVDVVLVAGTLSFAIFAARDLGASGRQVIRSMLPGTLFYIIIAVTIRAQVFAYPLFAVTVWLLASDGPRPGRRRTLLVFPILVLWANLHGSVTLGVGITSLFGVCSLVAALRGGGAGGRVNLRAVAFVIVPPLCLLATPYGTSIVHYYDSTLFNSEFGKLVTEWKPVTSEVAIAVLYAAFVAWSARLLWRGGRRTPVFEALVLAVLAVGGALAVRNIVWFGLATVVLLPGGLARTGRHAEPMPRRRGLDLGIACAALAAGAAVLIATASRGSAWFQRDYDSRAIASVETIVAQRPAIRVFSDVRLGDWLLWQDPALAGHVAYDVSFELLPTHDLEAFTSFYDGRIGRYGPTLDPYSVFVLDPANKKETKALLAVPGLSVVLRTRKVIVASKSSA